MPVFKCLHPTCFTLLPARGWCSVHFRRREVVKQSIYDRTKRNKELKSFYNSKAWKTARSLQLERDPICQRCHETPATVVHHLKPADQLEGIERCNPDHLQSVCAGCHARIEYVKQIEKKTGLKATEPYQPVNWEALRGQG